MWKSLISSARRARSASLIANDISAPPDTAMVRIAYSGSAARSSRQFCTCMPASARTRPPIYPADYIGGAGSAQFSAQRGEVGGGGAARGTFHAPVAFEHLGAGYGELGPAARGTA